MTKLTLWGCLTDIFVFVVNEKENIRKLRTFLEKELLANTDYTYFFHIKHGGKVGLWYFIQNRHAVTWDKLPEGVEVIEYCVSTH